MFDNWIEWFNGAAPNLENQLDALRRNGGAAAQPPQQPAQPPPAAEQAAQATPNEGEVPGEAWHCHWRKGEASNLGFSKPFPKLRIMYTTHFLCFSMFSLWKPSMKKVLCENAKGVAAPRHLPKNQKWQLLKQTCRRLRHLHHLHFGSASSISSL